MDNETLEYRKRQIDIILDEMYETRDRLKKIKSIAQEGIIIGGKYLGQDKIEQDLYQLELIIENLLYVRNHCNQKLDMIVQNNSVDIGGGY